jgi:Domain of unknown function (DUF4166)
MALVVEGNRLSLVVRRWSLFGLPLPMWLAPRSHAWESSEDGRFHFHVEISHPLTGLIVKYAGWLVLQPKPTGVEIGRRCLLTRHIDELFGSRPAQLFVTRACAWRFAHSHDRVFASLLATLRKAR